jgi:hypothetical protein
VDFPIEEKGGAASMAHNDRRNRGGTIRYVACYIDPAGRERAKSFTRRKDAEKYLTDTEAAKLKGTWSTPSTAGPDSGTGTAEWWPTLFLRPTIRVRDETWYRCMCSPTSGTCRSTRSASVTWPAGSLG